MRTVDLIIKKRSGEALSKEEIEFLISNYVKGGIPDYQMAAFLMAVYFQGMSPLETAWLTEVMAGSGDMVDLSPVPGIKVDKHSTGGVADTTTLVLVPLVAAAGVMVAKMSGRGLGHTGGTIDKLESIPGFCTSLDREHFLRQVREIGLAVVGQSGNLVPADKKLYALRDVTATVDSIPLIASSIMSKKIAAGADAIVLDVKTGSGAFMKKKEDAILLAKAMVDIGRQMGRKTAAVISDMNEPLGLAIGNSLEVEEAIGVLQGRVRGRLRDLCVVLGSHMLYLTGRTKTVEEAAAMLDGLLESKAALNKFGDLIKAQGGNRAVLENTSLLPQARYQQVITSPQEGYLVIHDARLLGLAAMALGAGRETKDSIIDLSVGLKLHARTGDKLEKGQPLLTFFYNDKSRTAQAENLAQQAVKICQQPPKVRPLVYEKLF